MQINEYKKVEIDKPIRKGNEILYKDKKVAIEKDGVFKYNGYICEVVSETASGHIDYKQLRKA